jgi:hypothetical protein
MLRRYLTICHTSRRVTTALRIRSTAQCGGAITTNPIVSCSGSSGGVEGP